MAIKSFALSLLVVTATPAVVTAASPDDSVRVITWADLIPKAAVEHATPKTFFSGATPVDANTPARSPLPEGKFMETKLRQPGEGSPPAVVAELDGKRVRIGGFIVPLDFEATKVKEFRLVPFVGACIHVPAPPANQIVYVKVENGIDVSNTFDAVYVTGALKTTVASTSLADAGYTLDAEAVTAYKP